MKWLLGFLAAFFATASSAQPTPHTKATLHLSHTTAAPGSTITAAVHLKMEEGWHTYWINPGGPGMPTKIEWDLPPGITAGEIQFPVPEKYKFDDFINYVYHGEAALIVPLKIDAAATGSITLKAKVKWLECQTSCIPGSGTVQAALQIGPNAQPSADAARIDAWQNKIPKPGDDLEITARWDGPASATERALIFSLKKSSGAWDFFNYPVADFELSGKTDEMPAQDGKVFFRKTATNTGATWPKSITGLALIPGDESSARIVTVSLADAGSAVASTAPATTATTTADATPKPALSLAAVLGLAFLGGLVLNIMPCVLPVIALKILGFVRQSNDDPKKIRTLGLVYAVGVIVSFMALAAFVIVIKQAGKAASWGMQFQNPQFVILITTLVVLVALNLFGVFEVTLGGKTMDAAGGLASREGKSGAFFNGVLATILATPCTAPFLAPALGFAFAASTQVILLVFLFVALGLAAPYVFLSAYPAWLKKLPKPGAWMEKFKIAMGFPMLATGVWLFSVALAHFGKGAALNLGLFLAVLAFAAWIFGEFVQRGTKRRGLAGLMATALTAFAIIYFLEVQLHWRSPVRAATTGGIVSEPGGIQWQAWTPAAVEAARAKGQPVLVDFTADWCLTCQFNKKTSIEIASVREKIKTLNVVPFLADNTGESPEIAAELQKYKRAGVPLVLVYPADPKAEAIVLPEVLKPSLVLEALEKAAAGKAVAKK